MLHHSSVETPKSKIPKSNIPKSNNPRFQNPTFQNPESQIKKSIFWSLGFLSTPCWGCQKHDVRSRSSPRSVLDSCGPVPWAHVHEGGVSPECVAKGSPLWGGSGGWAVFTDGGCSVRRRSQILCRHVLQIVTVHLKAEIPSYVVFAKSVFGRGCVLHPRRSILLTVRF